MWGKIRRYFSEIYKFWTILGGGGGGNRFLDRRISQKKLVGFRIWRIFYTDFRILLIERIADLSNISARIVDLACNLVRIPDCDFTVELLADSNLDKTIVGRGFCFKFGRIGGFVYHIHPPPHILTMEIKTHFILNLQRPTITTANAWATRPRKTVRIYQHESSTFEFTI